MAKNTGRFFLAGLLGAAAGVIGGLLLAPKSGKETREDISKMALDITKKLKTEADETRVRVQEVFGDVSDETKHRYREIRAAVVSRVATIKTAGEEIDKEKYGRVVDEVIADFKKDFEGSANGATKLADYFKKDWGKMKQAMMSESAERKTVKKPISKATKTEG